MLPRIFWAVFILVTGIRIFLAATTGLSDDEAYYWQWAQVPAWSYYDHPAMVAWLIAISKSLLGETPFAVRLPALLLNSATWWLLVALAKKMFSPTTGYITGILYLLLPIYSLGGIMMVPDSPMAFFWVLALFLGWEMFGQKSQPIAWRYWLGLGAVIGLGILSKYTVVLVGGSLFLFAFSCPEHRRCWLTSRPWVALSIVLVFTLPILLWNAEHHWPSFYYHFYERHSGGGGISWSRWGTFWAAQMLLLTPVVFFALAVSAWRSLLQWSDRRWRYIALLGLPTLAVFEVQALFADFKPHWPAPAYLVLLIGTAALWEQLTQSSKVIDRRKLWAWLLGTAILVFPINGFFWLATAYPLAPWFHSLGGSSSQWNPQWDPTNDLYGQTEVAQHLLGLREKLEDQEKPPFFASHRYQLCAPLALNLGEQLWCLSPQRDQYDFWQDAQALQSIAGRDFIFVSDNRFRTGPEEILEVESCTELEPLTIYRGEYLARVFYFWHCRHFQKQR